MDDTNLPAVYDESEDYSLNTVDYDDEVRARFNRKSVDMSERLWESLNKDGTLKRHIKAKKTEFVSKLLYLNGSPFSFVGREYLSPIYNSTDNNILLKTSRQVEKCVNKNYILETPSGKKMACDIIAGDYVWGYDFGLSKKIKVKVVASETNGEKCCVRIWVSKNRFFEVTLNHPVFTVGGWNDAGTFREGYPLLKSNGSWGEVFKVELIGIHETWAIQTENETIVLEDVVTHNTTFLGNNLVVDSIVIPYNKSLYVSPSHTQTRQFSNEKLKPVIEQSPFIANYLQDSFVSTQVFEKGFTNGSYIFLRSAFRSADRCVVEGEPVLMSDFTSKKVEMVQVGDRVRSRDSHGEPTNATVYESWYVGNKECVKIITNDKNILVSHDHRFPIIRNGKEVLLQADQINKETDLLISYSINENEWDIENVLDITPIGLRRVYDISVEKTELFIIHNILCHNTRGISARGINLDEIQDMMGSEIPVILECSSHFPDARTLLAGTPKSYDNPIENYWQESSQCEWLVPCHRHTPVYWNFLDDKNIAPTELYNSGALPPGPVCSACGHPINVREGVWTKFSTGKRYQGYRIPQLMVPWIISTTDQWTRLLFKRDTYPTGQFYNEVLGISYDSASKFITRDELAKLCRNHVSMFKYPFSQQEISFAKQRVLFAGVDWGEGNDGTEKSPNGKIRSASYTVLNVGYYEDQHKFVIVYSKKYVGKEADPQYCVKDIATVCNILGVKLCGVDWGHGWGVNNELVRMLGNDRVVQIQYLPKQKEKIKFDPIGWKYQVMRNLLMSEIQHSLKNGDIIFPKYADMEIFFKDALAIFVEYSEFQRQMKYDHKPTDPDDWFHSLLFCRFVADVYHGRHMHR